MINEYSSLQSYEIDSRQTHSLIRNINQNLNRENEFNEDFQEIHETLNSETLNQSINDTTVNWDNSQLHEDEQLRLESEENSDLKKDNLSPHVPLELSFSSCADPYSREVKRLKILFPIPPDSRVDPSNVVFPDRTNPAALGLIERSRLKSKSPSRKGSFHSEPLIHQRAGSFNQYSSSSGSVLGGINSQISMSHLTEKAQILSAHQRSASQPPIAQQLRSNGPTGGQQISQKEMTNALPMLMQKFPELLKTVEVLRPLSENNSFSSLKRLNKDKVSQTERHDAIKRSHLLELIHSWLKYKKLDKVAEVMQREVGISFPGNNANDDLKRLLLFAMDEEDDDLLNIPKHARDERKKAEDYEVQTSEIYGYDIEKEIADQIETHIWDEGKDKPQVNVVFGNDKSIQAATLNKLVERITDSAVNNDYRNTFMETYRSFTSPETILRKLFERYNVPIHVNQQTKNVVKTRVTQLLKLWIKDYYFDWNEGMLRSLEKFMDDHLQKEYPRFIESLQANCDRLRRGEVQKMVIINSNSIEKPLVTLDQLLNTENLDFYSVNAEEIARQITVIEHQIYRKIRSPELLNQAWNNKTLKHRSPNVLKLIERFNKISEWVTSEVVRPESLAKRVERYEYFIKLAQILMDNLHNFNTMLAVCSGLQNAAVNRLRHTKNGVADNLAESLQEMLRIMSTDDSYKEFRNVLKLASPPKLPYLGMFLTDITFIEDGNPDFIESKEISGKMLINWSKRVMLYRVIKQIRDYQGYDYAQYYAPIPQIQNLIEKSIQDNKLSEDELFELSTKREPKKAKLSQITP